MQTTMFWESTAYSPEALRVLEIKKNMALHSLKTRVNEARLDLRTRLRVLEHDRRQFERRYAKSVSNFKDTDVEKNKDKKLKLFTQSFDRESIEKWVVRGRHFRTLFERQTTMPVRLQKSRLSVTADPEAEPTEGDADAVEEEVQLPTISITGNPASAPSAVTFITEMRRARHKSPAIMYDLSQPSANTTEKVETLYPGRDNRQSSAIISDLVPRSPNTIEKEETSAIISDLVPRSPNTIEKEETLTPGRARHQSSAIISELVLSTPNTIEKGETIFPGRSRSYSLPVISSGKSSAARTELPVILKPEVPKVRWFGSNDIPSKLVTRRSSSTYNIIKGGRRKSSGGLSLAKVISNMGHGVMYTDLEERQRTIVSDGDWEMLRHCRYLRKPRIYEEIDEETGSGFE